MTIHFPIDWTKHPLHLAALCGNVREVVRLLEVGARQDENGEVGESPLHVAVSNCGKLAAGRNHCEIIRLLIEKGANLHARARYSGTPLHYAAERKDTEMAEILLGYGADINSQEEDHRRTPLHRAVANGHSYMVEFLISKGAKVNVVADYVPDGRSPRRFPDSGLTPLHIAAREGHWNIAHQLVMVGAAKDIKVLHGCYPFAGDTHYDIALKYIETLEERITESREQLVLLKNAHDPRGSNNFFS